MVKNSTIGCAEWDGMARGKRLCDALARRTHAARADSAQSIQPYRPARLTTSKRHTSFQFSRAFPATASDVVREQEPQLRALHSDVPKA